jgi:hypothetical protein
MHLVAWVVLLFVGLSFTQDRVNLLPWKTDKVDAPGAPGQEKKGDQ